MINFNPNAMPIQTSFKGKIMRAGEFINPTKKETIESYDNQIKKLEAYKQFAIKLDDLMFTDKDIQERINALPDDVEIEIANEFINNIGNDDESSISIIKPSISAYGDNISANETPYISFSITDEGPQKEEILEWLDEIGELTK